MTRWLIILLAALTGGGFPTVTQAAEEPHWAFQPLQTVTIPSLFGDTIKNPVDAFIQARLQASGLDLAPAADRTTLIRRLFLDLHGLPPTPERIAEFVSSKDPDAYRHLVEEVLASPHYGQRWAQHWLDVVRYADTHGYEVNTPRPNAWPYRDYVIDAFNSDKPYDEFVFEQLAGDSVQADAATGFMVASAVLLPGQIGQDDASKRLARQDALDEIIVATSETFLGLSVGCARCHDHKFDPIPQRDYYAMQAFFAGVEYGERPLNDERARRNKREAEQLKASLERIQQKLAGFAPPAFPGRTLLIDDEDSELVTLLKEKQGHGTNPAGEGRGYRDDQGSTQRLPNLSRGRYTWWQHQPGEDVFTYNPSQRGRFRIWLSWGVHGSGVHTRDARYLIDLDGDVNTRDDQSQIAIADQYYFANVHEGTSEQSPLWSGFHNAGVHTLRETSKIVLRGGDTGSGVTADVILLQEADEENPSPLLPLLRSPLNHERNLERFPPVEARFIRFTTLQTQDNNRHEPCIDELEVFQAGTTLNVGLAGRGAIATSSGDYNDPVSHKLQHINDGQFGNGRSWISNLKGGGWVQLELEKPVVIDRIAWGRDRDGAFKDRLPTRYRIEVALEPGEWRRVASSDDREPLGTPHNKGYAVARALPAHDAGEARQLANELEKATNRLRTAEQAQLVFAGTFREPDQTFVLNRGDAEQKGARVGPRVPSALGSLSLQEDAPESSRRVALARWVARAENPLTARVMANRIWQYHFGTGLVDTPSDFGRNGAPPSHPNLLDWLAGEFVRSGWSIKHLHRLILLSGTYRQSNRVDPKALALDAGCRLLWRFPARRLEAEAIRDSILKVNGRLNPKTGGPGFNFFTSRGGLNGFPPVEEFGAEELRRMIYAHKVRMERVPVFGAFDCPDAGQAMPRRRQSTTAIQALNLFNSPFVNDEAAAFARRIEGEPGGVRQRINRAFHLALGRAATGEELRVIEPEVVENGLATLCRVLFNSSEFLFIP